MMTMMNEMFSREMLTLKAEGPTPFNGLTLELGYNPSEFTIHRSVNWSEMSVMMRSHGVLQYGGGGVDTASFKFVTDWVDSPSHKMLDPMLVGRFLHTCTLPYCEGAGTGIYRPPMVELIWGSSVRFTGIVENFGMNALMVRGDGMILRAEYDVAMKGRAFSKAVSSPKEFFGIPKEDTEAEDYPSGSPLGALAAGAAALGTAQLLTQ